MLRKLWTLFDSYHDDKGEAIKAYLEVLDRVPWQLVSEALRQLVTVQLSEDRRKAPNAQQILRKCALIHFERRQRAENLTIYDPHVGAIAPDFAKELRLIRGGSELAQLLPGDSVRRLTAGGDDGSGFIPAGSDLARELAKRMRDRVAASRSAQVSRQIAEAHDEASESALGEASR